MKPQVTYLSNFTVLRGIGAIIIALGHYQIYLRASLQPGHDLSIHQFYLVVDTFFVMSGFIMLHVYGEKFKDGVNPVSFKNFIVARFGRVYPLHLFILLLLVAIYYLKHGNFYLLNIGNYQAADPHAILTNIFLLQAFHIHKIYTWNIPSWSLSAEWWPYFIFPLITWLLYTKKRFITIALLIFIPLAYLSVMYWLPKTNISDASLPAPHDLDSTFEYGFLRGFAGFFSGLLIYTLYQKEYIRRLFEKDFVYLFFFTGMFAFMYNDVNDILCLVMIAGLILSSGCNAQYVHKIGKNKILQFLGDISYSIYMNHLLVIIFLLRVFNRLGIIKDTAVDYPIYTYLLLYMLFLIILIAVSVFTYYLIEVKARIWINKKWAHRRYTGNTHPGQQL